MKLSFEIETKNFSLSQTLFSGQSFRFELIEENRFKVWAKNNYAEVSQVKNKLIFKNSSCDSFFWIQFFDLNRNYAKLLKGFSGDFVLETSVKFCGQIHILQQDPFEVLISFLFSSNNNIPRIKNIINSLCENFGSKTICGYSFPTLKQLGGCSLNDFKILKAGFRTKYILDAVKQLSLGVVNLNNLKDLNFTDAKNQLLKIKGVGEKIANCVLLFGFQKFEVFPIDVWIKKIIQKHYINGLSKQILSCPGFAQQLLYYSARCGQI